MLTNRLVTWIILVAAVPACAPGQEATRALQQELIAADRGAWEAITGPRPNMERVEVALASDYVDIDSGVRHARGEVIDYLRHLTNFSFQYQSARAYVLSDTSGYVVAELSYSSVEDGKPVSGKILTTSVFGKEHGRWVAHLHTEMDVKPPTQ